MTPTHVDTQGSTPKRLSGRVTRVVFATPSVDSRGGVSRMTRYLSNELSVLASPPEIRFLDTQGHGTPAASLPHLIAAVLTLVLWRVRWGRFVVHVNLASRGSTARKSIVVFTSRAMGLPVVVHLHGGGYREFFSELPRAAQWVVMRAFRSASRVIVLGEVWRDFVEDKIGISSDKITVLPNAVPRVNTRQNEAGDDTLKLLFLGRVGHLKGTFELLDALARPEMAHEAWRLTIAGDGEVERATEVARRLGIGSHVDVLGWVAPDVVERLLVSSHALVLPSRAEGLPMAVLEAMAARLAIVSTDVGALAEFLVDGGNALVIPPGDVNALATSLSLLLDPGFRRRLAEGAYRTWQTKFNLGRYAAQMNQIYIELMNTPR